MLIEEACAESSRQQANATIEMERKLAPERTKLHNKEKLSTKNRQRVKENVITNYRKEIGGGRNFMQDSGMQRVHFSVPGRLLLEQKVSTPDPS